MEENLKSTVKQTFSGKRGCSTHPVKRILSAFLGITILTTTIITALLPMADTPVYAAGTGKSLQLDSGVLADMCNTANAATVYYDSSADAWFVIGFDGNGIASTSGKMTLIAKENIPPTVSFHEVYSTNSMNIYSGSTLKFAIETIAERLSADEISAVAKRTLEGGSDNWGGGGYDSNKIKGSDVPDAVMWPLSVAEATSLDLNLLDNPSSSWWLRSPGKTDKNAAIVNKKWNTSVINAEIGGTYENPNGVRPAFNIDLESVVLTSAAEGGKDAGATLGTLNRVADYSGNDWKLTILDSSRNGFTASASTGATLSVKEGYTSWTVPVTYSGAPSGTNEHVSAILTDKDGVALYYGHIDHEVTIPTGLSGGTYYLKVFSEQCNGNNKTDLASPMSTIELKVKAKYDLEFDKNGGSGTMTSTEVYDGDTYTFPECGFTAPDDKIFYYWEMSGVDGEYQPEDRVLISDNCATNGKITVKAHWKDANKAVVKTEPEGKTLKYNGSEQELVSAGEAENGTMYYAIGDDDTTAPISGWSETVPRRKDKGTYYVWYKAKGTGGYADSDPGCTTATISDKDPVKVEKVELSDDKLTLSPGESEQITATIFPKNAADQTVSWKVGDESIIKITSDGKVCTVTAVATGETVVTVTTEDGGKEAVCTVIVEEEPNPKPDKCKISFAANGGEGEMKDQTVDKGVKTQLNANTFTRDGYTFDSWNTQADGKGKSYDDKDYITAEKDITLYAQWEKGKIRPRPKKHDDDESSSSEEASKPAVVNPDTVEGYFAVNGQLLSGVTMGKTKQGVAAQAIFNASRPAGWQEAFTFNMAINGKVDYTLKNGVLTIIIPKEFQKAGRTFAIMALDKNGKAWTFADTDTNPSTVTATINVEGYAFALIYKD